VRLTTKLFIFPVFAVALMAGDTPSVGSSFRPEGSLPRDILTNEGLVVLSDAGFSDTFIVEKILLSRTRFDTSVEGLAYLRRNALSEELVRFVMEHASKPPLVPGPPVVEPVQPAKAIKQNAVAIQPAAAPAAPGRQWYSYQWCAGPAMSPAAPQPMPMATPAFYPYAWVASR
jgi:hypothetical protein